MADCGTLTIRTAAVEDLSRVLALYAQPGMDDGLVLSLDAAEGLLRKFKHYPDMHSTIRLASSAMAFGFRVDLDRVSA